MTRSLIAPCLVLALATPARAGATIDVNVELPAIGHDVELDPARDVAYVSLPSRNTVAIVSTQTWTLLREVFVGPGPRGIDLSIDGTRLFVALNQAGAVGVLNLTTEQVQQIVVQVQMDSQLAWDVIEAQPNRVFATGNPSSGGFAYVIQILLDQGNLVQRVASNRIIRAAPVLEHNLGDSALYVGEGFSPNSLYKLDLSQALAPIVLEDNHGTVSGTSHLELSPDGTRIWLVGGQVLRTNDFTQAGVAPGGPSRFASDPSRIYVAQTPDVIREVSTTTFQIIDSFPQPCNYSQTGITELVVLPRSGFVVLGGARLCGRAGEVFCSGSIEGYCPATLNSTGQAAGLGISAGSTSVAQNDLVLLAAGLPPGSRSIWIYGANSIQLPFGDGNLCISPFSPGIFRLGGVVQASPGGTLSRHLDFTQPPVLGSPIQPYGTWRFQVIFRDAAAVGGQGFNTTSALAVAFCP